VQQIQTVMPRVQLLLTPLMFLSGAFFPITAALPSWLHALTLVNPLSYGVDALRRLVLHYTGTGSTATALHWGAWLVPAWLDVAVVVGTGALLLGVAAWLFSRPE
jgi:ABC-2 type transport system permease protein